MTKIVQSGKSARLGRRAKAKQKSKPRQFVINAPKKEGDLAAVSIVFEEVD